MAENLGTLADEVVGDAECVRAIAQTLDDLEHRYINCRTPKHQSLLRSILLDRLQEEGNGLAQKAKRLRARLRPAGA